MTTINDSDELVRGRPAVPQWRHSTADNLAFAGWSAPVALVATPIDTARPFYLQSRVGTSVAPDFQGGTLRIDQQGATDGNNYSVENFSGNTIDAFGHWIVFAGTFSGAGPLTIADSAGGGSIIVANGSALGGSVTIDSGATLQWGNGAIGFLVGPGNAVTDNGTLVMDFGSGGTGGNIPISGSGRLTIEAGELEQSAASTYSGSTTIASAGILFLIGTASIANSSVVADAGTFDISGTSAGASIARLTGSGLVSLGAQTLTISQAAGLFSGVIADGGLSGGTGGSLDIAHGTQTLGGTNSFTGTTTIDSGATLQLGAGGNSGTVAGGIVDNGLVRLDYSGPVTLANTFSGSGSVEVAAGTAVATGSSFIGGSVTIDSGATLQWGKGFPGYLLGSGNEVTDNGTLVMNFGGGGIAGSIPVSGSGRVTIQSGSLNESGVSSYSGSTTIAPAGDLLLTGGGSIASSSLVADAGTFDISGTSAGTSIARLTGSGLTSLGAETLTITSASGIFSGVIADGGLFGGTAGSLTIAGGTQTLSGTNTFTGITTVGAATLQLGAGGSTGTVAGGIVDNGLVRFDYSGPVTVASTLSGSGSVEIAAGTVVATGASLVGGSVTIDSGATLQWGNGNVAFVAGGNASVIDNGTLAVNFGTNGSGTGAIPISGSGKFIIQSGSLFNDGASTYSGGTTIASGATFALGGTGSIANSAAVADNGTFDISDTFAGAAINNLKGSGAVSLGSQTLTIGHATGSFTGVIADGGLFGGTGGALTIAGGSETLSGKNSYTGTTTIDTGATLQLGAGGSTGTVAGLVALAAGATLKIVHSAATSETVSLTLAGSDVVTGGKGSEAFVLAPGNLDSSDSLNGGTGAALDRLIFGAAGTVHASDFAHVSHIEKLMLANGHNTIALGNAMVGSADDGHLLTVIGGTGEDTVNAGAVTTATNKVHVSAGGGNDTLTGGAGADSLNGGAGKDSLTGNGGNDTLIGGTGNDDLIGGKGNDTLTGGSGADSFSFAGAFGKDTVSDFAPGGLHHDVIHFGSGDFANFSDVQAHMTQAGPDVVITLDTSDFITLHNVLLAQLHSSDFLFG